MSDNLTATVTGAVIGIVAVVFVALSLVAVARAPRSGRPGWLAAAMFGSLALYLVGAVVTAMVSGSGSTGGTQWLARTGLAVLLLFPCLVLLFAASFRAASRRLRRSALAAAVVLVPPVFALPVGEERPPWITAYLVAILVYWMTASLVASSFLWQAGQGQPTVARRRMRLMSLATTLLAAGLLLGGLSGLVTAASELVRIVVFVLVLFSGLAFMLGLRPPHGLVLSWRQPEEESLGEAMVAVLRAGTRDEVAAELLPRVTRTIGGSGAVLVDDGHHVVASHGQAPEVGTSLPPEASPDAPGRLRQGASLGEARGALIVWTSPYTPFFAPEEVSFLRRIAAFASLALERADLLAEERTRSRALHEAQQEAEQARRAADRANTAKSEFLSRMSHEFRTPLNAILGFGQLLELSTLSEDDSEAVGHVLKGGRHLLALVNDVLDLSRIEAGEMTISLEPVNADELVNDAVALMRPLAAARSIRVTVETEGDAPCVRTDRQRCRQILLNLLSNAVKYNHDGGEVHVTSRSVGSDVLRIAVRDTGRGIELHRQERLFQPFERLGAEDSGVEGTGLGLALTKQLVQVMGGSIGVESSPGDGATFWIDLPLTEAPVDVPNPGAEVTATTASSDGARKLLLVEDNLTNLRLVEAMLRRRPDIQVVAAMQGQLGLDLAYQHRPDVIVLDLHLPDISGREVLQRLKADRRTRSIPVIVASADASAGRERQLKDEGAFEYVTKPLDVQRFIRSVDAALAVSEVQTAEPAPAS